jgi:hypothetical protein
MIALRVNDPMLKRVDEARGPVPRAEFCRRLVDEGISRAAGAEVPNIRIESGVLTDPEGRVVVVTGRLKDGRLNLFDPAREMLYSGVDVLVEGFIPSDA